MTDTTAIKAETCARCQGNGEIILDWETYLHPLDLASEEKSVAECPDCDGEGVIENGVAP